ncbi:DedA family protein [Virgibacillus kekensis]|uniref:DedA family protein n=1 Tax=Virgibacillus kekensis TaxID=202261 RepID=A0ABV9DP83_9BACI
MLQFIVDVINQLGYWGLFLSLAVEASSIPFPGGLVTLTFAYILNISFMQVIWFTITGSAVYAVFSLIPFFIGYKMEDKLKEKLNKKKIERAQRWFNRFGIWTIAISRPLGLGNYISYAAGISKVKLWKFLSLTILGILPWTFIMLWVGSIGKFKSVKKLMEDVQLYGLIFLVLAIVAYLLYRRHKKNNHKSQTPSEQTQ